MIIKGSEILNKLIGAGLMLASVAFFTEIGHTPEFILPGLLFGAGGFLLALKRDRPVGLDLEAQQRLDRLTEGVTATQQELAAMQERLDRLSDERDFMRQLRSPAGARNTGDALPAGVPAPASAGSPAGASAPAGAGSPAGASAS